MKRNIVFVIVVLLAATMAYAAKNYVQPGDSLGLTFATTSPVSGAPIVKGTSKAAGAIIGVALNGAGTEGETISVATKGVFTLSVTPAAGNIAIGDFIYTTLAGDPEVSTAALSNTNTGILFGQALSAATSSSTARVMTVLLRQPGHL